MSEQIADEVRKLAIGRKIRTLRERKGLDLREVAERTGMPQVLLSQIEKDQVAPTVAALVNISSALGSTVDTLFQDQPFTEKIEVTRSGEGQKIRRMRQDGTPLTYNYESLAYRLAGKHMEPFLVEFALGTDDAPAPVSHEGEEFLYITAGEVEFISDEERLVLRAGDAIYFYSSAPHSLRAIGTVTPRAIAVLYPYAS